MTFEELLRRDETAGLHPRFGEFHRPADTRQPISTDSKCFEVISAAVWGRQLPEIRAQEKGLIAHCQGTWQLESYATEPAYSSNDTR